MALDKATYKASIKAKLLALRNNKDNPEQAADDLAGAIADGADLFVKGVTIAYVAGLTSPAGPVTGTFTYTIS